MSLARPEEAGPRRPAGHNNTPKICDRPRSHDRMWLILLSGPLVQTLFPSSESVGTAESGVGTIRAVDKVVVPSNSTDVNGPTRRGETCE